MWTQSCLKHRNQPMAGKGEGQSGAYFAATNIVSGTKKEALFNYPGGAGCCADCAPHSSGNCRNLAGGLGTPPEGGAAGRARMSWRKEKTWSHIDSKTAHRRHYKTSGSEVANGAGAWWLHFQTSAPSRTKNTFFVNNKTDLLNSLNFCREGK